MASIELKYCKYCDNYKLSNAFRHKKCLDCCKVTRQKYYEANKDELNAIGRQNRLKNIEQRKEYDKKYKNDHREEMRRKDRERYYKNKEKNKLKRQERDKIYKQKNRDKINKRASNRRKTDPQYKIRCYLSNAMNRWVKEGKCSKFGKSCLQHLSFTVPDLLIHLQSLFEPWMTWENHGKYNPETWDDNDPSTWTWQIDHIIPQANFKYLDMNNEEFKKCWSLKNMRPYSAKQNILDRHYRTNNVSG